MAQRLATEYVHASLKLTLAQLMQLIEMFAQTKAVIHARVMDGGSQQIELQDRQNQLMMEFRYDSGLYVSEGSYKLQSAELINVMRQAIRLFKGDAVVHRVYEGFRMIYHYEKGHVVKILESSAVTEKVIYEYRDTLGKFEQTYKRQAAEVEIGMLQHEINELLDLRNRTGETHILSLIDERLALAAHKLFVLEA